MDWRHEASLAWMKARRDVITATEICSCISKYNRANLKQKAGDILFPAFAKLWAKKQSDTEPEIWSKGPAARGHILEPYAIEDWNKNRKNNQPEFYHWDDVIIKNGCLGWSPDGLDVYGVTPDPVVKEYKGNLVSKNTELVCAMPKNFIEIKSYEPDRIMECMLTLPEKLDERWQMACAFRAVPTLETGYLLFYSINTDLSFYVTYNREDLQDEIKTVGDMLSLWAANVAKLEAMPPRFNRTFTEDQVYKEMLEKKEDTFAF